MSNLINDNGRQKVKVGTRGSLLTHNILEALTEAKKTEIQNIADKFLKVFQNPVNYLSYLQSDAFATELMQVCGEVSNVSMDSNYVFLDVIYTLLQSISYWRRSRVVSLCNLLCTCSETFMET